MTNRRGGGRAAHSARNPQFADREADQLAVIATLSLAEEHSPTPSPPSVALNAPAVAIQRVAQYLKQGDLGTLRDLASPSRSETARRLTCLFRPADPFALGDGSTVDASHVHRTGRGDDLVRSKSEVIVADALHELDLPYRYEAPLAFPGELPRHPDFTISRQGSRPIYWEHLGRLNLAGYRADWEARRAWYASHDILPWEDGGGAAGALVTSDENVSAAGIDSHAVRELARKVFASA